MVIDISRCKNKFQIYGCPFIFFWRVITRIIIDTDEEHSAQVARLVSGVIGLVEHQLNRVYGEVEAVRGWR